MHATRRTFAIALLLAAAQAGAQNYPDRPVRMLIGFTPGTATDIIARVLGQKLGDGWGQNVVAENRPGAGSTIAAGIVTKAAPDGYTLLFNSSAQAVNPALYAKLPYDTLKDFTPIAPVAEQPNVLVVGLASPIKTVAELVATAKAKPGQLNFGSAGTGTGASFHAARPGAYVDLLDKNFTIDDAGDAAGTIGYELMCLLGKRYQRVYRGLR